MSSERVYRRSPRLVARDIGGEVILVRVSGSAADMDAIFVLNPVGAFIWQHVDLTPFAGLVDAICETFEVDAARARADAERFVSQLVEAEALDPEERAP